MFLENSKFEESEDEIPRFYINILRFILIQLNHSQTNKLILFFLNKSSPRKNQNRFAVGNLSPKSPRYSDRSEGNSLPRFNNSNTTNTNSYRRPNSLMKQELMAHDEERLTPRSSRSTSEKDDFNNINMLSTMRHPLNDNSLLSKSKY